MSGDDDEWTVDDEQFESSAERETAEDSSADTVEEDDEWRFSLSDLEDDEEAVSEADGEDEVGGNVFGSLQGAAEELEAGTPSKENAFFVVVGVVLALLFFAQFLLVIVSG
jgi:ABC-type Na+ efflux pump permease subunit